MPAQKPCPLCKRPVKADYKPFCSRGCRDKDLLRWFGEDYSVPGEPAIIPDADAQGLD